MAESGVIKEFLVGLGWSINRSSQRSFEAALEDSKRAALALTATLTGVVAAVAKVAQSYEQLEYASQRAQSTVAGMQKFAFAISEMGGNADAARGSLQAMGNFLRSTPGGEGFIQRLGVQTRDANGAMRDTSSIMTDLSRQFRNMPYWRARATAGMLGIDENTLQAMIRGVGNFGSKYAAIYKRLGIDQNQAAKASTRFMQQFRLMGAVITAVRDKLAISLEPVIEHGIDLLYQFEEWIHRLSNRTKEWIIGLGTFVGIWRVMSMAIMQTPLGRLLALGAAVVALYDDYKTWQAGGKSLINWSEWKPGIDAAIDAIQQIKTLLSDLWPDVQPSVNALLNFFKHAFMDSLKATGQAIGWIARAVDDLLHHNFRGVWGDIKSAASQGWDNVKDLGQSAAGVGAAVTASVAGMDAGRINDAMKYLTSQGIDRDHALAMIGNWQQESSLGANLGTGSHRGLEQWDDNRRATIMQNTGIDVKTAGLPDQMRAALWELRNGSEAGHFQQFLKTSGVNEAAGYFAQNIERSGEKPGDDGFDKRIAYAHGAATINNISNMAGGQAPTVNQTVTINGATNPQSVADSVVRVTHSAVNTAYRNFAPRRQ